MYPHWLIVLIQATVWAAGISATLFVGLYGWLAPWRTTAGGRTTMELPATLALVCDMQVVAMATHRAPLWYAVAYAVAFGLVPVALLRRTLLLIRLQLQERRDLEKD